MTVQEYEDLMKKSGFSSSLQVNDGASMFLNTLQKELNFFLPTKKAFVNEFSEEDFQILVDDWTHKVMIISFFFFLF